LGIARRATFGRGGGAVGRPCHNRVAEVELSGDRAKTGVPPPFLRFLAV
jgi:hypothetical protein